MARRRLRVLLYILAALLLCLFVGWPTINAFRIRHEVASAVRNAWSVRLEEYRNSEVLTSVELPREEWGTVTSSLRIAPDIGIPFMISLCFVPHHRVVIVDDRGRSVILSVCFRCDEMATESSAILSTPYLWRSPLRLLFIDHHVPVRSERKYAMGVGDK